MKRPKLLVVGSLVMDLTVTTSIFPRSGETVLGDRFETAPGGKGANQAVQAARLGADVTMVGRVGADPFGDQLLQSMAGAGVDISHVKRTPGVHTAVGNILLEPLGEGGVMNRIVVVPGANMALTPEDASFLEKDIGQYDMVLLQLEIPMEVNRAVAGYAYRRQVPVMLNPAPYAPLDNGLLGMLTYLSPNEHEFAALAGRHFSGEEAMLKAAGELQKRGVKNVLITLGERGALLLSPSRDPIQIAAMDVGTAVDPTAAGDSFIGAFCTAVAAGLEQSDALAFASCAAALTVSKAGAQPSLPVLEEVKSLMERHGISTGRPQ